MGQRLLIVDNDRAFLKEHQVSLEAAFEIEVAGSPDGVIPKLERGAYAAVLVCVEVADNKGYALCTAIRKNAALADVKVAMISAKASEEEYRRHQSLKGRADLYLHKPIAPSALVAELTPFVPMRSVDPDNPLGDLADSDLGEDWLDGLKSDIATEMESPAEAAPSNATMAAEMGRPIEDAPSTRTMAIPLSMIQQQMMAPPSQSAAQLAASDSKFYALEAQVSGLEAALAAKDQALRHVEGELGQLRQSHDSVTQNLEELEKRQAESETLKKRLAEAEAALKKLEDSPKEESADSFKNQLRAAMSERTELLLQLEALNNQMAEKTSRTMSLMKEKDHLQQQSLEDQTQLENMASVQADRDAIKENSEALTAQVQALEDALTEATAKATRLADLERDLGQVSADLATAQETLSAKSIDHEQLLSTHAAAKEELEAKSADYAETESKLKNVAGEVAALEVTVRGQGREMVDLGKRLAAKEKEIETQAAQAAELEASKQSVEAEFAKAKNDLETLASQHEAERGELQKLIAARDGEIEKLKTSFTAFQETQESLERDKQVLNGQLAERDERLSSLSMMLSEAADRLRKGADLAKG